MKNLTIYESIAQRTQGDIYIGVVGPVRAGKSTFIKRFMDLMVVPNVKNPYAKERLLDEMPQSGSGKTITTTEPKFVPAEGVAVTLEGNVSFKVRMVDCVGYMVPGAMGDKEEGKSRMVDTPWSKEKIPFEKAAEIGTEKVITDHSTIGVVITTDGTVGELPGKNYGEAEERAIGKLKKLGRPFIVIVNSKDPGGEKAMARVKYLKERCKAGIMAMDCARMKEGEITTAMKEILYQFPVEEISFSLPGFMDGLGREHWIKARVIKGIKDWAESFEDIRDIQNTIDSIADGEIIKSIRIKSIDLGKGSVDAEITTAEGLYYKVVGEMMEEEIESDQDFFSKLKDFAAAKKAYDKLRKAMGQVEEKGYGIVEPKLSEMVLEQPEIFKQGNKFGIRLTAKAPSLHIIKTDITTEVAPIVGTEKQSEDLMKYLLTEFEVDPDKIWDTNFFGKSLYEMVTEQMENKLSGVPENIRLKVQRSLQKISDEGKEYFICIVI